MIQDEEMVDDYMRNLLMELEIICIIICQIFYSLFNMQ